MDDTCTCHLGTCLDHGTTTPAPPASAPVAVAPWPTWVGAIVAEHERLVRAGDILGAALHVGTWPDGLSECPCGTGECEGPEGEWRVCSGCKGHVYIWEPEAVEAAAESEAA